MEAPLLSIIVISFNTARLLDDCLSSIKNAKLRFAYEVIVVDNASCDESVDLVRARYPDVCLIANSENAMFAAANNQGARISRGRLLLLLNSDTIVNRSGLENLVRFMVEAPSRVVCVGPKVLNQDGSVQSTGFALPSIWERCTAAFGLAKRLPQSVAARLLPIGTPGVVRGNRRVGWVSGCCMLVRRDVYANMGGLCESLGFYGEEPEFGCRLQGAGFETWFVAAANIVHLGGGSSALPQTPDIRSEAFVLRQWTTQSVLTVGYRRAVVMSFVFLLAMAMKRLLLADVPRRKLLSRSIRFERLVIRNLWISSNGRG